MHKYLVTRRFRSTTRSWHVWADNRVEAIRKGKASAGEGRGIIYSAARV